MALRLLGEFAVIIVGVLVALAADRWNQARLATDTELVYLDRLAADVRADSVEAATALGRIPTARAARDSLLRAVDRQAALPQDLASAVFRAWETVRLPPSTTWGELTSSGAAIVISDVDLRRRLSEYYAARTEAEYYLASAELRGRYPFVTAMYPCGCRAEVCGVARHSRSLDSAWRALLSHGSPTADPNRRSRYRPT
jgi:hypothetical protein